MKGSSNGSLPLANGYCLNYSRLQNQISNFSRFQNIQDAKINDLKKQMNDIAKEYVLSTVLPTIETIPLIQTNDPNSDCDHSFYIESGFIYAKNINNDKVFCLKKGIMDYVFSYFNSPSYESFVIDKWRHIIYGITSNSIEMFNSLTLKYISSITNVHPSISKDDPNFEFSIHSIHPIHPLTTSTLTLLIVYSSKYLLYLSNTNISHFRRLDIEDEITNACLSGYSLCLTTRQHVYFIIESPALTLKNEENTYLTSSIELSSESVSAESFGMEFPIEDVKFQCSCYDGDDLVSYNLTLPSIRTITSTKRIYDTHDIRTLYNDNLKLFGQFTHSAFIFAAMGEETEIWDLTIDGGYNGNATTYLYHLKHFTESKQSIIFEGVHSIVDTLLNLLNMMNIIGKTTTATLSIKVSTVVSSNVDQQIKDFLYKLLINALLTTSNIEDAISLLSKQSPRYLDNDMRSKLSIEKELILCQTSTNGYENDRKRYGEVIFIEMQKILKDIQFIELSMLEFGFHDIYISLLLLKCKSSPIPSYLESLYTTLFEVLVPPDLLVQKFKTIIYY
ncbi:Nucleoporin Nup133/Nup155-like N-terminal domain-containing protein [Entamoeba marina]